jgi:hypothetical protein
MRTLARIGHGCVRGGAAHLVHAIEIQLAHDVLAQFLNCDLWTLHGYEKWGGGEKEAREGGRPFVVPERAFAAKAWAMGAAQ